MIYSKNNIDGDFLLTYILISFDVLKVIVKMTSITDILYVIAHLMASKNQTLSGGKIRVASKAELWKIFVNWSKTPSGVNTLMEVFPNIDQATAHILNADLVGDEIKGILAVYAFVQFGVYLLEENCGKPCGLDDNEAFLALKSQRQNKESLYLKTNELGEWVFDVDAQMKHTSISEEIIEYML